MLEQQVQKLITKKTTYGTVTFQILFKTSHFISLLPVTPRLNKLSSILEKIAVSYLLKREQFQRTISPLSLVVIALMFLKIWNERKTQGKIG